MEERLRFRRRQGHNNNKEREQWGNAAHGASEMYLSKLDEIANTRTCQRLQGRTGHAHNNNRTNANCMTRLRRKTKCQEAREIRDMKIYKEYNARLDADPTQSIGELQEYLLNKHNLHGRGMIYTIIKRVENKLKSEAV